MESNLISRPGWKQGGVRSKFLFGGGEVVKGNSEDIWSGVVVWESLKNFPLNNLKSGVSKDRDSL